MIHTILIDENTKNISGAIKLNNLSNGLYIKNNDCISLSNSIKSSMPLLKEMIALHPENKWSLNRLVSELKMINELIENEVIK